MEDRVVTETVSRSVVVGVFDGHGGARVADRAAKTLLHVVQKALATGLDPHDMWPFVFGELDPEVRDSGSTATLLYFPDDDGDASAAWVGDSRAVTVRNTGCDVLTPPHNVARADERQRVIAAGAIVIPPHVVDPRTSQGLAVTRALGDREMRGVGIIAVPETAEIAQRDVIAVVVATDGLWDVVGNEEAAELCRSNEPTLAAQSLVTMAVQRGTSDNVSVVVMRFARTP